MNMVLLIIKNKFISLLTLSIKNDNCFFFFSGDMSSGNIINNYKQASSFVVLDTKFPRTLCDDAKF